MEREGTRKAIKEQRATLLFVFSGIKNNSTDTQRAGIRNGGGRRTLRKGIGFVFNTAEDRVSALNFAVK